MRSTAQFALKALALVAIVGAIPTILAHGHGDEGATDMDMDMNMDMDMDMSKEDPKPDPESYPPTYFSHPEHVVEIYTHIALMVVGWVIMLPLGMTISAIPGQVHNDSNRSF